MTLQPQWSIESLERLTSDGFVYKATYTVEAEQDGAMARVINYVDFPDRPEYLIPYEDLTEDLVVTWVKDQLGPERLSAINSYLSDKINEAIDPKSESGVPWESADE